MRQERFPNSNQSPATEVARTYSEEEKKTIVGVELVVLYGALLDQMAFDTETAEALINLFLHRKQFSEKEVAMLARNVSKNKQIQLCEATLAKLEKQFGTIDISFFPLFLEVFQQYPHTVRREEWMIITNVFFNTFHDVLKRPEHRVVES